MARNILQMALPMTVAQLINILYNIVDRMYLGRLPGHLSLTGLGLCLPIISILMGFANLCGMGGAPLCSIHRGKGENEEAERILGNSFTLLLLFGGGLTVFCLAFRRPILYLFGASDLTFPYANDYLTIYLLGTLFVMIGLGMNPFINAQGFSRMGMMTVALGAAVNIVLDPIFIFGLFGMPRMEAAGAAVATVAGQWIGAAAGLTMNLLCNKDINLTLKGFRPAGSTIKRIYAVGIPSIAMNAIGSVMTFAMNNILIAFSSTAVAVFGVYFKLQSFVFMPIFGINNGMVPIIGYNYGARQPKRITQTIKLAVCFAECIMLCGLILAEVFPQVLLGVFNASPTMLAMGILALRIIAIHFPMAGFNVISSSAFQALGRGTLALSVSVIRQLVVLVPAAWLLSRTGNVNAVWFAFPIAELVAVTLCAVFMRKCHRDILLPMEAGQKTAAAV